MRTRSGRPQAHAIAVTFLLGLASAAAAMELFQVKLIEQDNARLVATSNYNYALASPKLLAKGWQTISVNGDQVWVTLASTGEQQVLSRSAVSPADMQFVEGIRDELANTQSGYVHVDSAGGYSSGGSSYMSSSSSSSSGGSSQYSSSSSGGGGASYSMRDNENFSVARSDLPYNWSRVFFNGNTLTFVYRNGDVRMQPMGSLAAAELEAATRLRSEVLEMRRTQSHQAAHTMQQSMDMVSNVFGNIMNQFPKPPDYQSSVGNMFGNNFPFGPNNSPFSAGAGWPFGGSFGGGAGAMAFAGGRRR